MEKTQKIQELLIQEKIKELKIEKPKIKNAVDIVDKVNSDDYKFFNYVNNTIIQQLYRILNYKVSKQELHDRLETIGVFANLIAMHVQGKDKSEFQFGTGDKDD